MKEITSSFVCSLIGMVIVLSGCSSSATQLTMTPREPDKDVRISDVDWAFDYDLSGLVKTNLIIEGTIVGIQKTGLEQGGPYSDGTIYTYYKVDIAKVLKNPPGFTARSVIIRHWGGTYQGKTEEIAGDEPYQIGQQVFLFLSDPNLFAGQPIPGEKKDYYVVLMPGGRFHIKPDGNLDSPTKGSRVAGEYRGKNVSVLEKDVLAKIANLPPTPTPWDYMQQAGVGAFSVVEGTVGPLQKTWLSTEETPTPEQWAKIKAQGELPGQVYTFYSFTVDQIIKDKLVQYKSLGALKVPVAYQGISPVKQGDVITVVEMDGTYEGITQKRRSPVPLLKPGDRMLLFLGAIACGERPSICTNAEQASKKLLYTDYNTTNRFIIGSDNRLTALFPSDVGRAYDKQDKTKLEKDLTDAIAKYEKDMEDWMKKQPTPAPVLSPPPTRRPYP